MPSSLIVLKFGSSVLSSERDLPRAVHEIYRSVRRGERVIAVVSAFAGTTDRLLRNARRRFGDSQPSALAALLGTGETSAAAQLVLALDQAGIPSELLDPAQAGLRTRGEPLDAEPSGVDRARILAALNREAVVVLPGFIGRDENGATTLLGRGGSDLTAIHLASSLHADRCVLLKDVDGLYAWDPAKPGPRPNRFETIRWSHAAEIGGRVAQAKAVRLAESLGLSFEIGSFSGPDPTIVGPGPDGFAGDDPIQPPLRVALLGCGTVGFGVLQRLTSLPQWFELIGIAVRDIRKTRSGVPRALLSEDPAEILARPSDVVIELIGGVDPAARLIESSLVAGRHVITANKAVLARDGERLERIAAESGVCLLGSASVGGAIPAIEIVRQCAAGGRIRSIDAVLNGTTNFILDRFAAGDSLARSLRSAQRQGFAEADPSFDLDGTDAAQKLSILAREAFGVELDPDEIAREGIVAIDPVQVRKARERDQAVRLLASIRRREGRIIASVRPVTLPIDHPLGRCHGADNAILIESDDAPLRLLRGKGAGRWPTAEAVIGDLLDLIDERKNERAETQSSPVEAA